jgi:peroxiredoxin
MLTMLLTVMAFWWTACQSTSPQNAAAALDEGFPLPPAGIHAIEEATDDLSIEIIVQGLQGGTAKMIGIAGDQNYIIDTATIDASGRMHFKSEMPYPRGYYYVILPDQSNIQLLIDANQRFKLKTTRGNLINGMEVIGSRENELLYRNLQFQPALDEQIKTVNTHMRSREEGTEGFLTFKHQFDSLSEIRRQHILAFYDEYPKALFTKFKLAGQNPELTYPLKADGTLDTALQTVVFREAMWDNVDFTDDRLLRTPIVHNKLKRYIEQLTPQHQDSIIFAADRLLIRVLDHPDYFKLIANYIPLKYQPGSSSVMDAEAIHVHMVNNYFTPERAFWASEAELNALRKRADEMAASRIGLKGPDVKALDQNGVMRSIYEMQADYIVVFMWNPECDHCREETPKLIEVLSEWKPKGLDVFGIAVNTTEEAYKKAAKAYGMTWNNVFDPTNRAIYATYYVDNTPEIYVLNPDRTIIAKNLKAHQIPIVVERDMQKRRG